MNTLVNRLRGQYEVGPDNEFGTRSFAEFIPPISLEAADRIEVLSSIIDTILIHLERPFSGSQEDLDHLKGIRESIAKLDDK